MPCPMPASMLPAKNINSHFLPGKTNTFQTTNGRAATTGKVVPLLVRAGGMVTFDAVCDILKVLWWQADCALYNLCTLPAHTCHAHCDFCPSTSLKAIQPAWDKLQLVPPAVCLPPHPYRIAICCPRPCITHILATTHIPCIYIAVQACWPVTYTATTFGSRNAIHYRAPFHGHHT